MKNIFLISIISILSVSVLSREYTCYYKVAGFTEQKLSASYSYWMQARSAHLIFKEDDDRKEPLDADNGREISRNLGFIKYLGYCSDCIIKRHSKISCNKHENVLCDIDRESMDRAVTAAAVTYLNSESFKVTNHCGPLTIKDLGKTNVILRAENEYDGGYY